VPSGNEKYLSPDASAHTDACRALLFAWRLRNVGLPAVNDLGKFPCGCAETGGQRKPWRLKATPHPSWCVVPGEHAWTECTITVMVPKETT
jgi:hypothetical protein